MSAPRRMIVLNVELSTPYSLTRIDDDISAALVICRMYGRVVGQFEAAVENGYLNDQALHTHLPRIGWSAWTIVRAPGRSTIPGRRASIVVCTRDRTEDLVRCLASLRPALEAGHEIVVVDSCPSTGDTARLISQYAGVKYVLEPRPGLGIARNRGLRATTHDVVALTDDDAEVEPGWIDSLLINFDDPMTALVTGLTLPRELDTEAQIWFERTNGFQRGFKRREFDLAMFDPLGAGAIGAGVNMALRRAVLVEIGMFDEELGPGTESKSGDDHEFFYRILARGYRAVYDPDAVVRHRHRRDWKALQNVMYGYGAGVFTWWTRALMEEGEIGVLVLGITYFWHHHAKNLARALCRRPGSMPLDLAYAEFAGALAGPRIYYRRRGRLDVERRAKQNASGGNTDKSLKSLQDPRRGPDTNKMGKRAARRGVPEAFSSD